MTQDFLETILKVNKSTYIQRLFCLLVVSVCTPVQGKGPFHHSLYELPLSPLCHLLDNNG